MNNKKLLMFISALMIIIFHLWYSISTIECETILRKICVIGVDIFFFISAFNIGIRKIEYKSFLKNRIVNIYLKFIVFSIIYVLLNNKNVIDLLKIVLGIDLFISGGGSFLWFIPAIIIMYVLLPLYKVLDEKYNYFKYLFIVVYTCVIILISLLTDYRALFILLNRVPIILLGYYFGKTDILNKLNIKLYWLVSTLIFIFGFCLAYYVTKNPIRLDFLYDVFYILNIPLVIGVILLVNKVKENRITNYLGGFTLELYAVQMLIGFKLAIKVYNLCKIPILTNIIVIIIIFIISLIINKLFEYLLKLIKN